MHLGSWWEVDLHRRQEKQVPRLAGSLGDNKLRSWIRRVFLSVRLSTQNLRSCLLLFLQLLQHLDAVLCYRGSARPTCCSSGWRDPSARPSCRLRRGCRSNSSTWDTPAHSSWKTWMASCDLSGGQEVIADLVEGVLIEVILWRAVCRRYWYSSMAACLPLIVSTSDSAPAALSFGGVYFQPYSRAMLFDQVIAHLDAVIGVGHDGRALAGVADHHQNAPGSPHQRRCVRRRSGLPPMSRKKPSPASSSLRRQHLARHRFGQNVVGFSVLRQRDVDGKLGKVARGRPQTCRRHLRVDMPLAGNRLAVRARAAGGASFASSGGSGCW